MGVYSSRMADLVLGVDVGTTATKLAVADLAVGVLAEASATSTLRSPSAGWAEENPVEWWGNICGLVPGVLRRAGVEAASIRALGVSGMVPTLICLDKAGRPIRPSIQQNDARAAGEIAEAQCALVKPEVLRRTGSPISQQSIGPKVLWLQRHEPDTIARTHSTCGSYDFIVRCLVGGNAAEANWALESGLYDLTMGDWAADFCEAFGVARSWLGTVRTSSEVVGEVQASEFPELAGTAVVAGCANHVANAFSVGLFGPGNLVVELGGAGNVLVASSAPIIDERLYLDFHLIPGVFVPNGCMATTGSLLRWFQRELAAGTDLEALDREAAAVGIGAGGLVALPYFLGEKTPINDPLARGVFAGLHLGHTRGHLFRALLEGVGFAVLQHLEVLRDLGLCPECVRLTGGGARSALWRQILADVLNRPVECACHLSGSALGAAFAAAVGTGVVANWDHIKSLVRFSTPTLPDPGRNARYRELFEIYRALYPNILEQLHALARLSLPPSS